LGLPLFLLPGGRHSSTPFGSLPSSILWTCPYIITALIIYLRLLNNTFYVSQSLSMLQITIPGNSLYWFSGYDLWRLKIFS
jgi:hypothetical protein